MLRNHLPTLLFALAAAVSVAGCAGRYSDQAMQTDRSTVPNRSCNPALVINPAFLSPNEGVAGAGGPDLPGIGAASDPNCPRI